MGRAPLGGRFGAEVLELLARLDGRMRRTGCPTTRDVTDDWSPIYDRTDLNGFYVAMGTSGNQFKNAPLAGRFLATLVDRIEAGHDHDRDPLRYAGEHTGNVINLAAFSRKRHVAEGAGSRTVMG
ncbi:hypothetical protein [Streptomyces sp. NPDC001020]